MKPTTSGTSGPSFDPPGATPSPAGLSRRQVFRATLLALLATPPLVYFALYAYLVVWTGMSVGQALPRLPLSLLVGLLALNALLRGPLGRWRLAAGELRLVYALTAVGLATCGVGYALSVMPTIGGGLSWYATHGQPGWATYAEQVPDWLEIADPVVRERFYVGHSTLYRADHLRALARPVAVWSALLLLLLAGQLCLAALLRRQWLERERLTFPLVHLPLALTEPSGRLWRSPWFLAGLAVALLLNLHNGLGVLIPALPEIRIKSTRFDPPATTPWSGLGPTTITFYPFVIGVGYLLATDVSLGLWLGHWLGKLTLVGAVAVGARPAEGVWNTGWPHLANLGAGAFAVLGLTAVARLRPRRGDAPRWAIGGLVAAVGGLLVLGLRAGLPGWLTLLWLALHALTGVAVARLVAEAGAPLALTPVYPQQLLHDFLGPAVGPVPWTRLSALRNADELYTDYLPVHALSGYKAIELTGSRDRLASLFALLAVVGLLAGLWALADIYFRHGVMNVRATWPVRGQAQAPWQQLDLWLAASRDEGQRAMTLLGAMVMGLLVAVRQRCAGWPVHPLGFAAIGSHAMPQLWLPLALAWLLKAATLKAGGLRLYRRCLPAALGLILGDILMPQLWTLVGVLTGQTMYFSFPS